MTPEFALTERHTVFAVFPLDVAIAELGERVIAEASSDGEFSEPFVRWDIHAVRGRVADDEAHTARRGADGSEHLRGLSRGPPG